MFYRLKGADGRLDATARGFARASVRLTHG
jgi:hypothetical protein